MADRVVMPRALDDSGAVVADATAYFFETGTTNPLTVYSDSDGLTPLGDSVDADATGIFPEIFVTTAIRLDIRDGAGVSINSDFPSNDWYVTPSTGVGASTITFSPIEGNAATEVQTAIGNLTALWNAVSTYGRSLIASIDAAAARTTLGLGTAATTASTAYATAAQGTLAANALPTASYFGPVAYANVNGVTTATVRRSEGAAFSIARDSAGVYTVTMDSALADTDYSVQATAGDAANTRLAAHVEIVSTTVFTIYVINHGNGAFSDSEFVFFTVYP